MQQIILIILVVAALVFLFRKTYKNFTSHNCEKGCGCDSAKRIEHKN